VAQARRKSSAKKTSGSHGMGMFIAGVVVGVVTTAFFMGLRSDDPESIGRGIAHMMSASESRSQEAVPEPSAIAVPRPAPSFDFYEILPEIEQIIPDNTEPEAVPVPAPVVEDTPATKPADVVKPRRTSYVLQAGSFARLNDADRLKAQLALEGLVSKIQKVSIEGRGDFYRVRLGPFDNTDSLKKTNQRLAAVGIKALRLKISSS
jgi:cell division protein FtsN